MKKIKKNLFIILAGTSIFASSNAVRLFPLSSTEILVDHDECLQVEFEQNSFNLEPNFTGNYFRWISWDNHSFMVLKLNDPIEVTEFLDTDQLHLHLMQSIKSVREEKKHINPFLDDANTFEQAESVKTEFSKITFLLNDIIRSNDKVRIFILELIEKGKLDECKSKIHVNRNLRGSKLQPNFLNYCDFKLFSKMFVPKEPKMSNKSFITEYKTEHKNEENEEIDIKSLKKMLDERRNLLKAVSALSTKTDGNETK